MTAPAERRYTPGHTPAVESYWRVMAAYADPPPVKLRGDMRTIAEVGAGESKIVVRMLTKAHNRASFGVIELQPNAPTLIGAGAAVVLGRALKTLQAALKSEQRKNADDAAKGGI